MTHRWESWVCRGLVAMLLICCLCIAGFLPSSAAPTAALGAPADPPKAEPPQLETYTSKYYVVHTNLPREEGARFAAHMDAVFVEYRNRFRKFRARDRRQMPLYLFRTNEDYLAYLDKHDINGTNTGGMFAVTQSINGLFIYTEGRPESSAFSTLQHEGFHQFAHRYLGRRLPIWVNEGMAQYFEDGIMVKNRMKLGIPNEYRLEMVKRAIKEDREIPFDELLASTSDDWRDARQNDVNRSSLLYAQSWSVVYFLVHANDGRYRPAFEQFLALIGSGRTAQIAFERAFRTKDTAAFETRWREYLDSLEPNPINAAVERMEFLARGLRYLQSRGEKAPESIEALRERLTHFRYRAWKQSHDVRITFDATDESLYTYTLPNGGTRPFQLLAPSGDGLPQRISAQGLRPEPTLTWKKDDNGQLVTQIEYR